MDPARLEQAAQVLYELAYLDADSLPPGTDWVGVGRALVELAGKLRKSGTDRDLSTSAPN